MSPVLKLSKQNEKNELSFELKYLTSLSIKQRFEMMLKKSEEVKELLAESLLKLLKELRGAADLKK